MKKSHLSVLLFGVLLAALTVLLHFIEYRFYIGSLNTDVYTAFLATIFTGLGIWLGLKLFRQKHIHRLLQ